MDVDLVNFVFYFIIYLFVGFVFFYFTLFKKAGSNIVGTICVIFVFISLAIGLLSALHLAILNLFVLFLGFWFAYTIMKMHHHDKMEEERRKSSHDMAYSKRITKKQIKKNTE